MEEPQEIGLASAPNLHSLAPPPGATELLTPAWRCWLWSAAAPKEEHVVYITASPEHLSQVVGQVLALIGRADLSSLLAVRLARDARSLERINAQPEWAGKAVTLYLPTRNAASAFAQQADAHLADMGWHGPPALRARPFGGKSGLVFVRGAQVEADPDTGARRNRLSALLGGSSA